MPRPVSSATTTIRNDGERGAYRMRWHAIPLLLTSALSAVACTREPAAEVKPDPPRTAVALVGKWHRVAPFRLRGDTLVLSASGTASGIVPYDDARDLRATQWSVQFGSRSPAGEREDWRHGYTDGGDPECFTGDNPACTSMPILCIGGDRLRSCNPFVLTPGDSLLIADGSQFKRLRPNGDQ